MSDNFLQHKLQKLDNETWYHSNLWYMTQHPVYIELYKLGEKIVPDLIKLLQVIKTWSIIYLLSDITKLNPVKSGNEGYLYLMAQDWIDWYEVQKTSQQ